ACPIGFAVDEVFICPSYGSSMLCAFVQYTSIPASSTFAPVAAKLIFNFAGIQFQDIAQNVERG
ncbi:MAG: hypothetical protein ACLQVW_23170, partial [Limisphaerales bacterium]